MVRYRVSHLPREFQFDSGTAATGLTRPRLVLLSRLHLDSGPYTLVLTAHDGGEPASLTGTTTVTVTVEDSNDHRPTFTEELVTVQVCGRCGGVWSMWRCVVSVEVCGQCGGVWSV